MSLTLIFLLFFGTIFAQNTPKNDSLSLKKDSTKIKAKVRFFDFKTDYPNPRKAGFLSLMLPGAGQVYNKRLWKVPLVYGALGGMTYLIINNNSNYNTFYKAYKAKVDPTYTETLTDLESRLKTAYTSDALKSARDFYKKNLQLSYIGLVAVYLLNGAEAFIDAHLKEFNVDDNLSLKITPATALPLGIALRLDFAQ